VLYTQEHVHQVGRVFSRSYIHFKYGEQDTKSKKPIFDLKTGFYIYLSFYYKEITFL